jgi:hypothetical protein
LTPTANFATCTDGVNTGSKFAIGVNDTGGKFATGVNDTGRTVPFNKEKDLSIIILAI